MALRVCRSVRTGRVKFFLVALVLVGGSLIALETYLLPDMGFAMIIPPEALPSSPPKHKKKPNCRNNSFGSSAVLW